jgi:hypothetical protein
MIDSTYQSVVSSLPPDLHEPSRRLLAELGLAHSADMRWGDVFQLEPSRDLPLFAATSDRPYDEATLEAFRRAHHCACFYNVLVDRMADQQAACTPERERLAEHFLAHWQRSLAEADGDEAHARREIDHGVRAWRCGVRLERAALARRSLGFKRYGLSILLKLGWAGLASECLLRHRVDERRRTLFRRTFCLLATGMQCVDDAMDSAEDEALHGRSFPTALQAPPHALYAAGTLLTRAAAFSATLGRFPRFAEWLFHRAGEMERICDRRVLLADKVAGMVIASSLEALCFSVTGSPPVSTAGTTSSASST